MRFRYVLLLFCVMSINALSQNNRLNISGKVKDKNGLPIAGAMVAIEKSYLGTYTNETGYYSFDIPIGTHAITVSSIGYKTIKKELNIQKASNYNFILEENQISLETVEVLGKAQSQRIKEGVFSATSLDVKKIANTNTSLSTVIGRSNGIKIREDGGLGSNFDLSINGLYGNSVKIFIDGIPISSKGRGVTLANLPTNIVNRIEIYKGVVPADLGADALGGAINIITKQEQKTYIDASYSIGSFNTHKTDFNAQYIQKKTGLLIKPTLSLHYSKNNYTMRGVEIWDEAAYEYIKTNAKRFHDDYLSFFSQLEFGIVNKKWTDSFFISTTYSTVNKELQTGSVQSRVYGEAKRENQSLNVSSHYKKKNFLFDNLSTNLSLSHTWDNSMVTDTAYRQYRWDKSYINSSRNEITGRGKSIREIKRPLTIVRSNFNYSINENHSLNFNYLLNHIGNKRKDKLDSDFDPSEDSMTKHILGLSYSQSFFNERLANSFFVKNYINQLKIGQRDLSWITGSKTDPFSSTNNIGYGLGARYRFFEAFSIKSSFERTTRLASAREYLGNGTTIYPNFRLKPESSKNINLELFGSVNLKSKQKISYELNFFARKVKDYIRLVISEAEGLSQYNNVSNVEVKGVEFELKYEYKDFFQTIVNTSYLNEINKTKYQANGKPDISYENRIPNRPWLYSNLEFNIYKQDFLKKKDSQLKASYYFQYVHWFYLTWKGYGSLKSKSIIPTQYVSNIALSYSLKKEKYNISLECNNLFDRTVYDNFMRQKPGRSFLGKFRIFIH